MDMTEIQFNNDSDGSTDKKRRFSVHDVKDEDNELAYGQVDNPAIASMENVPARITSVDDTDDDEKSKANSSSTYPSDSQNKSEPGDPDDADENGANVFIHENVDDNDEYANDQFESAYHDDIRNTENTESTEETTHSGSNARDSKENTPEPDKADTQEQAKDQAKNEYPSHYRHPSLAPDEEPADDDDLDKDHGRYLSTLIHNDVDTSGDDDDEIAEDGGGDETISTSKKTKLYDHWCHGSSGIAIEDDTDAKALYDKQTNHAGGGGVDVNQYTRPFMSKIDDNGRWDTVFGNGIVSDTDTAYVNGENGRFIEWIIEVNNMNSVLQKRNAATIQIGISSDLMGETNSDAFTEAVHGYGFDNLGHILHEKEVGVNSVLQFGVRDVIHVILDYSDPNNWRLYAKIGDFDEEDYDDLEASQKMSAVFAKVHPGSYRLAVSLFSQMDALVIESCRIHGHESATFYQELGSYSIKQSDDEPSKDDAESPPQSQSQQQQTDTGVVEEKVVEVESASTAATATAMHMIPEDKLVSSPPPPSNTIGTAKSPSPFAQMNKQQSVIIHDSYDERDRVSASPDPAPKQAHGGPEEAHVQKLEAIQKESAQRITEQQQSISALKQQIESLQTQNAQKQTLVDEAKQKDEAYENRITNLEQVVSEYKESAHQAQQKLAHMENKDQANQTESADSGKLASLTQENERLTHELKLATDRMKSLDVKKQEMQDQLNRAIDSKLKLVTSTSEEIDHYRHLIQQIAQNKMACQVLSEYSDTKSPPRNGYY